MRGSLTILIVAQLLCLFSPAQTEPATTFTEADAARLLRQVVEGLEGHSARKMLGAFDLSRMDGGAAFKEQITAFFNQYETVRVHFKLIEVVDDQAVVDAEMDGTPRNAITPPEHKSIQLRFTGAKGNGGWKFIEVHPRGFFS